jgi:hypothetical protein
LTETHTDPYGERQGSKVAEVMICGRLGRCGSKNVDMFKVRTEDEDSQPSSYPDHGATKIKYFKLKKWPLDEILESLICNLGFK